MDNSFNQLTIITEESLPEVIVHKTTNLDDAIGTGNDGQKWRNKGKGKGRGKGKKKKQQQQSKNLERESRGDLIESESGKQYEIIGSGSVTQNENENENDTFDYNYAEKPIILTEMQHRQFKTEFEPFISWQKIYLEKEFKQLNQGEILHKSSDQLLSGMTEEIHDGNWHKTVRKVLVKIMEGTQRFWRTNVAQIVPEEPSVMLDFYKTMTAIYLGPSDSRNEEVKKMIPRVNKTSKLVRNAVLMHNKKSVYLFVNAVNDFKEKYAKFEKEFDRIDNNPKLNIAKKEDKVIEAFGRVTSFYKANFVVEEKFSEYFHVSVLMYNDMPKDGNGAKLYSCLMRLANSGSTKIISKFMAMLFHNFHCENLKAEAMEAFNVYFAMAHEYPSNLDIFEMDVAQNGLKQFGI